jgi:hypothetical protein
VWSQGVLFGFFSGDTLTFSRVFLESPATGKIPPSVVLVICVMSLYVCACVAQYIVRELSLSDQLRHAARRIFNLCKCEIWEFLRTRAENIKINMSALTTCASMRSLCVSLVFTPIASCVTLMVLTDKDVLCA